MENTDAKTREDLLAELNALRWELEEANDTIQAIRGGSVDALIVNGTDGPQLYSLTTADHTYRVFVERMNEGAVTLNSEGVILYSNSTFAKLVDCPVSAVLGAPFVNFIPENCRDQFRALFKKGWGEDVKEELPVLSSGRRLPCQISISKLSVDDGVSLSLIITDLSLQKEAEMKLKANNKRLESANAALEQSNLDLMQFASVASHDLQEPLRKIMVFSGMLAKKLPAEATEDAAMFLEKITSSSKRMKALITDILAYSQLSKADFETGDMALGAVLQDIIDDFELLIRERGAVIQVAPMPTINGSRAQMRQVFQNLIANALKFSRPGIPPHIQITSVTNTGTGEIVLRISDNGIGFDTKYSDRIFALFQRLNTKVDYEGSGIGLAITKKIVERHGGRISVQSEEGEGTVFQIVLPVYAS